ncbi:MAG: type I restriction-modification system subunit M N-terminal domain-containing protein [Rhodospirillales bacterium]|nr:type I restriction-modification system subunit M N-terminal domain-containing protein [Rhodospirillales bacterium]
MSTDIKSLGAFVWSIAERLRGDFKQPGYGKVILPFVVLRRLDGILEPTRPAVREMAKPFPPTQAPPPVAIICPCRRPQMKKGRLRRTAPQNRPLARWCAWRQAVLSGKREISSGVNGRKAPPSHVSRPSTPLAMIILRHSRSGRPKMFMWQSSPVAERCFSNSHWPGRSLGSIRQRTGGSPATLA